MENAFNKLAGYKEEKKELLDICNIISKREKLMAAGGKLPKGIFLVGPTGVGKTKLARAFIAESHCPCVEVSSSEMKEGEGFTQYIKAKFKEAVSKVPCIIFIDELDKFAGIHYDPFVPHDNEKSRDLLNEINKYNDVEGLFLLLIANSEITIDEALVRSGRIDKKIKISNPNETEREEIIRLYASNKQFEKNVNFSNLAKITQQFSGADIESWINDALIRSINNNHKKITNEDIMSVYHDKVYSCKEKDLNLTGNNQKMLAYHEAGHATISLLNGGEAVFFATIMPRGKSNGFVSEETSDKNLRTTDDLKNYIKVCLAGIAAEDLFFSQRTTGSSSDIDNAKTSIRNLVRLYGICGFDKIDIAYSKTEWDSDTDDYSERKKKAMEKAENKLFKNLYETTKRMITKNKGLIEMIADALIEKKFLNKEDIIKIYDNYKSHIKK